VPVQCQRQIVDADTAIWQRAASSRGTPIKGSDESLWDASAARDAAHAKSVG
jgi:hypothetical protein